MFRIKRVGEITKEDYMKFCTIQISNEAIKYLVSSVAKYKELGDKDDVKQKEILEDIHKNLLAIRDELNPS